MSPAVAPFWRRTTVRARLMRLVLLTTVLAVWVAGIAMLSVDVSMYRKSLVSELSTEESILALSTAAALEFDDRPVAERNLSALEARAGVLAAALYTARGALFASYVRPGNQPPPVVLSKESLRIAGDQAELVQPVRRGGETVGYIYLRGRYDLVNRIAAYVGIFVLVTLLSLAVAFLFASRLQARITRPLEVMVGVAREIVNRRDYSLRAQKTSEDETGVVVDAFNNMLEAVQASSQALREADRRKDEFLATLAHELRNPLAPIRHSVKLLESPKIDERQREWAREVISRQVQRMALLLDDLLDVSRITRGRLALKSQPTTLESIVNAAVETARPLIDSKRHALTIDVPADHVVLNVDSLRISQSLSNLLTNAAKYTDPGGRIALTVRLAPEEIEMSVKDSGIGFDPESLTDMFTMFAQVGSAIDRAEGGLGIGLALVKGLTALHGGTVSARSAGAGHGSEFAIHLPRGLIVTHAAPPADPTDLSVGTSRTLRVLVADDNRDAADSLATILEMSGNEVSVAHSGEEALRLALLEEPQAIILDIGMPGMNGYEVARRVREETWGKKTLLIAVTGWGQAEDKQRSRDAGFDHHLTKPIDVGDVERLLGDFQVPRAATH
jgi:signal transduction histidine kinase/ActR/RegA family two-component response regulator